MTRTAILAAVAGALALAGCTDSPGPAAPPTSEEALTTATTEPAEDEAATSEPAVTTEEPEADGPPEMPAEASEQTEEGAEAFVEYYIDLINYTGTRPQAGLLEPLGAQDCKSCKNHEDSVIYGVENGDYLEKDTFIPGEITSTFMEDSSRISVELTQVAQPYLRDGIEIERSLDGAAATLIFRVSWDDRWEIDEITIQEQ